ncbi:LADA_0B06260g1_1 [Lachancea dasiensis]|uniref:Spindle pole component BBP1 n=1 Tax=Lachancea dasiensis TaxID=1072105 RepID=A0A1G4ITR5_9SACH|nr:LADA_0B06260g1_1 [Lachancea dasiensis]
MLAHAKINDDADDNTGGIYKWTMDALFGRRVSPSRRFKEASQDDTNYKLKSKGTTKNEGNGVPYNSWTRNSRQRSSSTSSISDKSFLKRYDLLQDEENMENTGQGMSPVRHRDLFDLREPSLIPPHWDRDHVGQFNVRGEDLDSSDTFSGRKQQGSSRGPQATDDDNSLKFRVPRHNDPLISKLFGKEAPSHSNSIPGKFPSPLKHSNDKQPPPVAPVESHHKDFTDDYLQLLQDLDLNGQKLRQLQEGIQYRHDDQQLREASYREKYLTMRQELITELKQSKRIYDNYYKLYAKYKQLKDVKAKPLYEPTSQQHVRDLEAQVVDASIERAEQVRKLNDTIFSLELKQQETLAEHERERIKYQSRIAELESLLRSQLSGSPSKLAAQHPTPYSTTYT